MLYDSNGNILTKHNSSDNTTVTYGYNDPTWADLLTSYNGYTITYDTIGNPLTYNNGTAMTFTWANGRNLQTVSKGSSSIGYAYDSDSNRTSKTVDGAYTQYIVVDGVLYGERRYNNTGYDLIIYLYDENGNKYGFTYNGTEYYYQTNLQGDVVGIYDSTGQLAVQYTYDAWGKLLSATGTLASTIGQINPIRYRGYYYDTETGFYYLQSRYYDPEIGRWINPEPNVDYGGFDEAAGLLAYNSYAYCANNPIVYKDENGESITVACIVVFGIIGAAAGGYAGYRIAKHYKIPKGQRWKYVLGGIVIGGAAGALLGWGVGIGVSAASVKIAGTALFGKVVTSGGMLIGLATQYFEKTKNAMNVSQLKHLITLCQKYGVDITARLVDLTKGHGAWSGIPHIHIGDKQIHIALTKEAVKYIRNIFGI